MSGTFSSLVSTLVREEVEKEELVTSCESFSHVKLRVAFSRLVSTGREAVQEREMVLYGGDAAGTRSELELRLTMGVGARGRGGGEGKGKRC